jgi:hypothetical protein
MQSGHCGIPLSIKGGPGHGRKRAKRENKEENSELNQRAKSRQVNLSSERREKRPTRSTYCELLRVDRESLAPRYV